MSFRTLKLELCSFVPELNALQAGLRLNRSYEHLLDLHTWSFLYKEALLKLVAPVVVGGVTTVQGSPTVTGIGTAWTSAVIGMYLRVSNAVQFYQVVGYPASQTLTLESAFNETGAVDTPYVLFKHIYAKPTDCKDIMGIRYDLNLPKQTKAYIDTFDPNRESTGQPWYWLDNTDTLLEVYPPPDQIYTLRVWYRRIVSLFVDETDTALLPERLILSHALRDSVQMLALSPRTDPNIAKQYLAMYQTMIQDKSPSSFDALWAAAVEADMKKISLPKQVLNVGGIETPQSNDYWSKHDVLDPRRP